MGSAGASGSSLASAGLSAYSDILKAQGTADADNYKAAELEQQATYGDLKAVQASGQMTRNLNTTLGNIDAIRAAANSDPGSPTGMAYRDNQEAIGTNNKNIMINSILQQSVQERNDASYYQSAASQATLLGYVGAATDVAKSFIPILGK